MFLVIAAGLLPLLTGLNPDRVICNIVAVILSPVIQCVMGFFGINAT